MTRQKAMSFQISSLILQAVATIAPPKRKLTFWIISIGSSGLTFKIRFASSSVIFKLALIVPVVPVAVLSFGLAETASGLCLASE
jgi:hypothetical protein